MRYFNKQIVLVMIFKIVSLKNNASELALLVEMLHENGAVSDAQYMRLKQELEATQQKKAAEAETGQADYQITLDQGIKVTRKEQQFEMKIGGCIQADGAWYGEDEGWAKRQRTQQDVTFPFGYVIIHSFAQHLPVNTTMIEF